MKTLLAALLAAFTLVTTATADVPADAEPGLEKSPYVYIASTRKDGNLSRPAEIWFFWHQGAVFVATPADTWRVKRIRAGRKDAKIWVGKPDGPSFLATGEIADEPKLHPVLFETFAKKYPDQWKGYEERFRTGLKDGSRVLVKYTPK